MHAREAFYAKRISYYWCLKSGVVVFVSTHESAPDKKGSLVQPRDVLADTCTLHSRALLTPRSVNSGSRFSSKYKIVPPCLSWGSIHLSISQIKAILSDDCSSRPPKNVERRTNYAYKTKRHTSQCCRTSRWWRRTPIAREPTFWRNSGWSDARSE